ncbi:MAG: (deoxy)nucleoside triphosphate pyrophosphohydrolase [Geobacteraceae bacterium]|nr:(deoxy)nucleoside triphosphate pyrophosphohydrolase [Geobacteraceae bacterium]
MKKTVLQVACAVIEDEGKVLAAQRNVTMSMPLKWEFPGGKLHDGESPEECLERELEEELGIRVTIRHPLPPVHHRYQEFAIELIPFVCTLAGGTLVLHEHRALAWLSPHELTDLDWPAADIPVIDSYLAFLAGKEPSTK